MEHWQLKLDKWAPTGCECSLGRLTYFADCLTVTGIEHGRIQDSIKGGSIVKKTSEVFDAMPTFALTTPTFDQRHQSHLPRSTLGSRPEIAQNHS